MMTIRKENISDMESIRDLQYQAFKDHPQHQPGTEPTEHLIVDALRKGQELSLSLVAEMAGEIVGHIAFSGVRIGGVDGNWFGLGPVGVLPGRQRQGIGSALVKEGIGHLKAMGASGIVLVGDPGFYDRFGFRQGEPLTMVGVPSEYLLALILNKSENIPCGEVEFNPAFFVKP